tara:strand:+ start:422 stop:622 length:201 start_codon:yes stop_codon:yes gene_type:complete
MRFSETPAKLKKWHDILEIEKLKRANPRMTYKQIAEKLEFSLSKVSTAFAENRFSEIPHQIRASYE